MVVCIFLQNQPMGTARSKPTSARPTLRIFRQNDYCHMRPRLNLQSKHEHGVGLPAAAKVCRCVETSVFFETATDISNQLSIRIVDLT